MASYAQIDPTMPITLNASHVVISNDQRFVELAARLGNDALRRVGTMLGDRYTLTDEETQALFQVLDIPENRRLIEGPGELQCIAMDDQGRDLLSAWVPIDQALDLFPIDHPVLGALRNKFATVKAIGADLLDFDFYKRPVAKHAETDDRTEDDFREERLISATRLCPTYHYAASCTIMDVGIRD